MKFSKTGNSTQLLNDNTQGTLRSNFTPFGIWAFSIGTSIACGMAKYDNEPCVAPVFEQADQKMYENKNTLKEG